MTIHIRGPVLIGVALGAVASSGQAPAPPGPPANLAALRNFLPIAPPANLANTQFTENLLKDAATAR